MKHNFVDDPDSGKAEAFRRWLETETLEALRRDYGNADAFKASVFLFANRAYEARLPEAEIAALFGRCLVRAGYHADDEEAAIAWLDYFSSVARKVHSEES